MRLGRAALAALAAVALGLAGGARGADECAAEAVRAELDAARRDVAQLQKSASRVEALEAKVAELEAARGALAEHERDAKATIAALQKQLAEANSKAAGAESKASSEHKRKIAELKSRHERELDQLRQRAAESSKPLILIALERSKDHLEGFQDWAEAYWKNVARPGLKEGYTTLTAALEPQINAAWDAAAPLREIAEREWAKLRPQFDVHVKPHLEIAKAHAEELLGKAWAQGRVSWKEFTVHFRTFRQRSIGTLKTHPAVAPYAEVIIDSTVTLVVILIIALLAIPMIQFYLRIMRSIICSVLYVCCCCCCCGCGCRGRRAKRGSAAQLAGLGAQTRQSQSAGPPKGARAKKATL